MPNSDNALMTKVSGEDVAQLGLLFERHHKMLYGYFTRLLPGRAMHGAANGGGPEIEFKSMMGDIYIRKAQ